MFESANKKQVLLQDVLDAGLVDSKTARKFDQGKMTPEEVKSMVANLKVFVDGTMPIAGVINSLTGKLPCLLTKQLCLRGVNQKSCNKKLSVRRFCAVVSLEKNT